MAHPEELAARAQLTADPWQVQVLESAAQTLLINCSRQAGKSTIVGLLVARTLIQPEQLVILTAPSQRQSKELYRKVLAFWRRIGRPVPHVQVSKTSLELVNGSRLEAVPGSADTIVGFTPHLVVVDEAARVEDELYSAVSPMLAVSGGRLVAPSTPKGKRGWWWSLWESQDDPDVERVRVPATEVPRISPAFLARELRRLGQWWYDQEYMCVFQEAQSAAFREQDIAAVFREDVAFDQELFAS